MPEVTSHTNPDLPAQLLDTRVVVTGAGHGIGRSLARMLSSRGARVVVNDIDARSAECVAEEVGGLPVPGDLSTEAAVVKLVDQARAHLGKIDVWFGNAGVESGRGLGASESNWQLSHEVNVMAHVRAARLLVPDWVERGTGRYVMTASAAGLLTMLDSPAYSATKHAAVAFAEWLSATYRHRGVIVQALCPQGVRTRMLDEAGALQEVLGHDIALEPDQVAQVVADALADDRFLILPHPQVAGYYQSRASNTDMWLQGMNKLQRRLEQGKGRR